MAENDMQVSLGMWSDVLFQRDGKGSPTGSAGNGRDNSHVPIPEAAQPFPRSPRLIRKIISAGGKQAKELLSRRLEELQEEQSRTEAHLQSLKKRSADLMANAEVMKQQVSEQYDSMRRALHKDERAVLDSLEQERREAGARVDELLRAWKQHLAQVKRDIGNTRKALEHSEDVQDHSWDLSYPKKKVSAEEEAVKMDKDRFLKLTKTLTIILHDLQAHLQRKTFVLDSSVVEIDKQTCHKQILVGVNGRRLCLSPEPKPALELPLQFDKVYCALGSAAVSGGQRYWEVDIGCCAEWALGAAYGRMERKGTDKGAKLGRNHHSWCLELRNGSLSAWHNNRRVACRGAGAEPPHQVGVFLDYAKGRLAFYDTRSMRLLQEFSAALMPMFDRQQHQFTEPLYPAFRFFKSENGQLGPNHMEICSLGV